MVTIRRKVVYVEDGKIYKLGASELIENYMQNIELLSSSFAVKAPPS